MNLSVARFPAGRPLWLVAYTAAIAAGAWLAHSLSGTPLVGYDDANVFFVYARNLVGGHGFVFNAGGERVEGFTSLLWLLICSAARLVTPRFEFLLFAINIVCLSVALWWLHGLMTAILTRHGGGRHAAALAFVLTASVALAPGFVVWNVVSLMDAGLWSSLFIITTAVVLRQAIDPPRDRTRALLPLLLIALVLTRPEALLVGPVVIAASMLAQRSITMHLPSIVAFAGAVAALLAWRLSYFGYPLPNSYYATAEPLSTRLAAGFDYFSDFALANPLVPLALAAGLITLRAAYHRARTSPGEDARSLMALQSGVVVLMVAGCVIPIAEGGDRFGFWRLLQPVAPVAAIQVVLSAAVLAARRPPLTVARTIAVAIMLALVPWRHWAVLDDTDYPSATTARGFWYTPRVEIAIAGDMRHIGAAFDSVFPDVKPTVGVIVAGGFALAYSGPTIDLMGHNLVAMAHAPGPRGGPRGEMAFSPAVFTALSPDVVLLSRWSPDREWFAMPMLSGVYDRPAHLTLHYFERRFASMRIFDFGVMKGLLLRSQAGQRYAWASVRARGGDRWIHAIFNRQFLTALDERGYDVAFATSPQ